MASPVVFPFLTAADSRVSLIWTIAPEPNADGVLAEWEPSRKIAVSLSANVDLAGIKQDCALKEAAALDVALTWASQGTSLRGCVDRKRLSRLLEAQEVVLEGEIAGTDTAARLELCVTILAGFDRAPFLLPITPNAPVSIVWRSSRKLLLEGTAAQFPMEAVDFRSAGFPADAPWHLEWNPSFPGDLLLGSVRLYVNSGHPLMVKLLTDPSAREELAWLQNLLRYDVISQLSRGALESRDFLESPDSHPDGSVGAHVNALLRFTFPNETVGALAELKKQNPGEFEVRLKSALAFLPQ